MSEAVESEPGRVVLIGVVIEGALAAVALGLGRLLGFNPLAGLYWTWSGLGWGLAATLPPLVLMIWCTHAPWGPFRSLTQLVDRLLLPIFAGCTTIDLAMISIAAGVGEEVLFRGLLQGLLGQTTHPWIGLAVASLAFGLAHFITPTYAIFAALLGLYLGGLWLLCDNLLAPLVTHATYDFAMLLYLTRPGRIVPEEPPPSGAN